MPCASHLIVMYLYLYPKCPTTEAIDSSLYVQVYNPLAWERESFFIELPVSGESYRVLDEVCICDCYSSD